MIKNKYKQNIFSTLITIFSNYEAIQQYKNYICGIQNTTGIDHLFFVFEKRHCFDKLYNYRNKLYNYEIS